MSIHWNPDSPLPHLSYSLFFPFPFVKAYTFTRQGGVSSPPFDSLNCSIQAGDSQENVTENYARIKRFTSCQELVTCTQVHGDSLHQVFHDPSRKTLVGDGLFTKEPGLALLVKHADCQAALFLDPTVPAIAAVHSGWRGLVQNIYQKTVNTFQKVFNSDPKNLFVAISPSLGPNAAEFIHYKKEFPQELWQFEDSPQHLNLWKIAEHQLQKAGIPQEQISIADICTYHDHRFFSYRRLARSGRNGSLIQLTS